MVEEINKRKIYYQYIITTDICIDENGRSINVYGIAAVRYPDSLCVQEYRSLSTDIDEVKRLVDICNEDALDIIHLKDVAEDFVS